MKFRELWLKIDLKLRPLQLGEGQRALDEVDGLAADDRATATEKAPPKWAPERLDEEAGHR
ncbi:MAG TPA: hypothetical protein VFL58_06065 [Gaiellaceae bacterium]|nr:hypothetical protein [Gaiellaceae bacterium]